MLGTILYRGSAWTAVTMVTAFAAHGVTRQVCAGVLTAIACTLTQLTADRWSDRVAFAAITGGTILGLIAVVLAPSGLAEVPVYFLASRFRWPVTTGWGRWYVAADAIAVGVVIAGISGSYVALLSGLGVPLLAQRATERRQLIASRDEARALLVEVQAGREAEAEAAALHERGRIAGELHDVLAHSLAGLSVQLQATRAVAAREQVGPTVLEPLDKAAVLARDGLAEARSVVSTLRDPVGLDLAAVPALVARQPGEVTLTVVGTARPVEPRVGHAIYRAVQEALTNAARYAPGAAVTVTIEYLADTVRVAVVDSGLPRGRAAVPSQGTGLGLVGMDERVRSVGGTVTAGPQADGGWAVRMEISA